MTPAARLQAAIDILAGLEGTAQPADRFLQGWFRAHRFAGSQDRRAIAARVFAILRHRAKLSWRMGGDTAPRALAIASLLSDGEDPASLFAGGYGPAPLTAEERARMAARPGEPPSWVRDEFPPFLEAGLTRAFGPRLSEEMAGFAQRAPVDLRVNTLKAARDAVLAQLRADGFAAEAIAGLADGIRCPTGSALDRHPLFAAGAFEIQDAAAQMAVALADARPGMRVLDLAAGAGGKALAMAAAMENRGEIIACDIRPAALAELERRAARAGVTIIRTRNPGTLPPGPYDIVFLDAPCSGSGTWRRQPDLKWRLTPDRLAALCGLQTQLLTQAAGLKPGRLVYATCSVLPCENEDRVAGFLASHPDFRRLGADFHASPAATGTDGFYAALLGARM